MRHGHCESARSQIIRLRLLVQGCAAACRITTYSHVPVARDTALVLTRFFTHLALCLYVGSLYRLQRRCSPCRSQHRSPYTRCRHPCPLIKYMTCPVMRHHMRSRSIKHTRQPCPLRSPCTAPGLTVLMLLLSFNGVPAP